MPAFRPSPEIVHPTREDPVLASGAELLGGPAGRRMMPGSSWWTPIRILLAVTAVVFAFGVLERAPCRDNAWSRGDGQQYAHACYSDIPHMWRERGFAEGKLPYVESGDYQALEYPVLSGVFMQAAAIVTKPLSAAGIDAEAVRFYDVNAFLLGLTALAAVGATVALAGRRRPWDALGFAASPMLLLTGTINWDLFAVALTMFGLLAWARGKPVWAGIWLGLAVSAKLYPAVILLPLALLCVRARKIAAFRATLLAAAGAWLAVNLPVALAAPSDWWEFYSFNSRRGAEFGSIWFALDRAGHAVPALNVVSSAVTLLGLLAVASLAVLAPRRPRVAQLAFLAVAVFVLANKVWSPQYILWLLPLAVLARPRWRDLLIWQAGEIVYFFAVWYYLLGGYDRGLPQDAYTVALLIRFAALAWFVAVVVRDVLDPECDPVRASGEEDPAAGLLARPSHRRTPEAAPA
ncbi:MAG: glycosyltransferase family 87 protein [Sporichthyaceae bacterium]